MRIFSVLPLVALGVLAAAAGPLQGQGYRVDLDARMQGVSYRGWQVNSIPIGSVVTGSDGLLYTSDGVGVTGLAGDSVWERKQIFAAYTLDDIVAEISEHEKTRGLIG